MHAEATTLPTLGEIRSAAEIVYQTMPPTPQYRWPLLERVAGRELWVKHENHTPAGAFKVRGGLVYFDELRRSGTAVTHVICATRGNHGQSVAFAATRAGIPSTIIVPHNNSREKNAAMAAFGATVVEHGDDLQEALDYAQALARERDWHFVPSFHSALVRGVASYGLELFTAAPHLETVYAPIGLGSSLASLIAVRDGLGLKTELVAAVAQNAPAYALSLEAGEIVAAPADSLADGISVRVPNRDSFEIFKRAGIRVVRISEEHIADAMRTLFTSTHNVAEGAGAASLAAALADPHRSESAGVILTGGNVDADVFARVLAGG